MIDKERLVVIITAQIKCNGADFVVLFDILQKCSLAQNVFHKIFYRVMDLERELVDLVLLLKSVNLTIGIVSFE